MKVVLVTGLSGSGKSVAIRALEDAQFYCVDNLPPTLISNVLNRLQSDGIDKAAIAVDARTGRDIVVVPEIVRTLRSLGMDLRVLFLDANDSTLSTRYSESRRRHPMSQRLSDNATVLECIQAERESLETLRENATVIDTSDLFPNALRRWVLQVAEQTTAKLTLVLETFGYKKGLPTDADLVFDVRCLSNPHYDPALRRQTGKDAAVKAFIEEDSRSSELLLDIENYLRKWIPSYINEQRSYFTVAIGCTGGQHRSVYVAETLAQRLNTNRLSEIDHILIRHRNLDTLE